MSAPWTSVAEIEALVQAFESCDLPAERWHHREHLTITCWYIAHYNDAEALDRVQSGIQRFNAAKGIAQTRDGGYHETLTRFLFHCIRRCIDSGAADRLLDQTNAVLLEFVDWRHVAGRYYSRELMLSWEARVSWLEPDLRPLD